MESISGRLGAWVLSNRRLVRAPLWLYQHHLGWLLGDRILMLEHVGRRSGEPRFVCLEIVERPSPDAVILVSGFGTRAQWYRNLLAQPRCWVSTGRLTRRSAYATILSPAESDAVLAGYQQQHPGAWRHLRAAIEQATGTPVTTLPMVCVTLTKA